MKTAVMVLALLYPLFFLWAGTLWLRQRLGREMFRSYLTALAIMPFLFVVAWALSWATGGVFAILLLLLPLYGVYRQTVINRRNEEIEKPEAA